MAPEQLEKIEIKKVLGPTNTGTAVLLGNDEKTFVMFIGLYEGAALIRELNGEPPPRPLTHELMTYLMAGFNIEIKRIIISDIVNSTFCATLILEQKVIDENEEWVGKRNEVRIDARPSDCLVLALKEDKEVWCSRKVLDKVRDISEEISNFKKLFPGSEFEDGPPEDFPDLSQDFDFDMGEGD